MKRKPSRHFDVIVFGVALVCLLTMGCKKKSGTNEPPPDPNNPVCVPAGETTTLVGNEATWQVQYGSPRRINKIIKLNKYGQQVYTIEVQTDRIIRNTGGEIVKTVYNANIYEAQPTQAKVSIKLTNGLDQPDYYTYNFSYDAQKRLSKIEESTATVTNDREWSLTITYNDKGNVTKLLYAWTTHPGDLIPPITVDAYDGRYSPYAGIRYWKYLMYNYGWDNYDPEPVLSVLSTNNPLDYTMHAGTPAQFKRTMSYVYSDKGFPLERSNVNTSSSGETSFKQTFSYTCQ